MPLLCKVLARRVAKLGLQEEAIILRVNDWSTKGASALSVIEHIKSSDRPLTIHFLPYGQAIPPADVSTPVKAKVGSSLFVHDCVLVSSPFLHQDADPKDDSATEDTADPETAPSEVVPRIAQHNQACARCANVMKTCSRLYFPRKVSPPM